MTRDQGVEVDVLVGRTIGHRLGASRRQQALGLLPTDDELEEMAERAEREHVEQLTDEVQSLLEGIDDDVLRGDFLACDLTWSLTSAKETDPEQLSVTWRSAPRAARSRSIGRPSKDAVLAGEASAEPGTAPLMDDQRWSVSAPCHQCSLPSGPRCSRFAPVCGVPVGLLRGLRSGDARAPG
jgi:hypothetical protein